MDMSSGDYVACMQGSPLLSFFSPTIPCSIGTKNDAFALRCVAVIGQHTTHLTSRSHRLTEISLPLHARGRSIQHSAVESGDAVQRNALLPLNPGFKISLSQPSPGPATRSGWTSLLDKQCVSPLGSETLALCLYISHDMATTTSTMTASLFKDPSTPQCTPVKTAKLWDETRDRTTQASHPQRASASEVRRERNSNDGSSTRSSFDFKFRRAHAETPSTTVAICKSCKQAITTIVLLSSTGETAPPLSPAARNLTSTDIQQVHKDSSVKEIIMPTSTSSKRKSFCPMPTQFFDPPIRFSSLPPPPTQEAVREPARSMNPSLTDPNEPFLRLQTTHPNAPRSQSNSHPASPTYIPTTPTSTSHSRSSTRPSSLANVASLPASAYPYARNNSATPSEFSTLYPYSSTVTTSPPSLCRVSYALQNTTSAWDDWGSDDDAEKVRLVGWMGRRKVKSRGSGKEGKESMDSSGSDEGVMVSKEKEQVMKDKSNTEEDRLERARVETAENAKASRIASIDVKRKKRPSGFVRVFSCGCSQE
ncbi:hypothetical protein EJ02DRAFT_504133 [Clathrospora elynae]|uniref:Uncharacterized protein n=1 Tax=Clathrospora elynae TaxID=706981 RepID=A0A6A5SPI1_9PLEO|nr:hypothetical protein EJ02DRAFT_504133 [Clathrospora elynae]